MTTVGKRAGYANFVIERGSTWNPTIEIKDADGNLRTITGETVTVKIYNRKTGKVVEQDTGGGGDIAVTVSTTSFVPKLTVAQVDALQETMTNDPHWLVMTITNSGDTERIAEGPCWIDGEVSGFTEA